jgi:hypothetical protein
MEDTWKKLVDYLKSLKPGLIEKTDELERLLWDCWDQFEGSDQGKMEGFKLLHRMEEVFWEPPILKFSIERHGPTVGGSIWANIQGWELNVETREAICEENRRRQVSSKSPALTRSQIKSMAEEIVRLILDHVEDERLKWNRDGTVRVQIGEIIPEGKKETTIGRRKRFRAAVEELLANKGWLKVRPNVYAPPKISNEKS